MRKSLTVKIAAEDRPSLFTPASKASSENVNPNRDNNHAAKGSQRILPNPSIGSPLQITKKNSPNKRETNVETVIETTILLNDFVIFLVAIQVV